MDRFHDLIPVRDPKDKRRYICAWLLFGGLLLAYAIYLAVKVAQSYDNPGAKIGVSKTQPPWPVFAVCYDSPLEEPVVIASWIPSPQEFNFQYQKVNISSVDSLSPDGNFNCVQFNYNKTITKTAGKLAIFGRAFYSLSATRSVARLFILPQDKGPFTNYIEAELYDELILPTGSLVEAKWTVLQHVRVSGEKDTRYQLVQQVEALTTSSKKDIVQQLSSAVAPAVTITSCESKPFGSACTFGEFTGVCTGVNQTTFTDEACAYHCTNGSQYGDYFQISWRCDGYDDCYDAADELGCGGFECLSDNQTYTKSQRCNGVSDCLDSSDESNCTSLPIILAVQVSPYTQYVTITEDVVTFGWESFFASLASGWSIVTLVVAFLFPDEAESYVKWRLRRGSKAENENEKEKEKEKEGDVEMNRLQSPTRADEEMEEKEGGRKGQDERAAREEGEGVGGYTSKEEQPLKDTNKIEESGHPVAKEEPEIPSLKERHSRSGTSAETTEGSPTHE